MRSIVILEDKRARLGSQEASAAWQISRFCEGPEAMHVVGAGNGVVHCYPSLTTGEPEPTVMTFCSPLMTCIKLDKKFKHLGEYFLQSLPSCLDAQALTHYHIRRRPQEPCESSGMCKVF